ncbi:MAG: ABC transporter substrate-binding protein, partial [Flavobacteriaceae bacterium]|nr:ABC transporter substrate-binding protein [Flavobacteriaceae bacterium]
QAANGNLYVAYGTYSLTYNPAPVRQYGLSHLTGEGWNNIPNDSLFQAANLNTISINPFNPNQAFVSSYFDGIVEINDGTPTVLYDQNNSGLESLFVPSNPSFINIRVSGSTFDRNGVLWSMTSRVDRPLKSYNPDTGQWRGFDFTEIIPDGLTDELGFSDIVVDNNGVKWIGSLRSGLIGYNDDTGEIKNIFDEEIANLPDPAVKALAIDNRNQLWIGTIKGLRVLYNTSNFFNDETVGTQPIIILEDGIPKELLQFQYISDIKVDGGNNKWVSTIGSGIFYFTSDGQETIYHFTKDNSPLPSNNVTDTSIDSSTGIVYIATDRGLVSFRSGSSKPFDDLEDAFVFPNPVRPGFDMFDKKIKIKDISENVNIKITDIEGNLVAEAESNRNQRFKGYNLEIDGGTAYWNGKNLANNEVSSGVYLVMLSDLDTLETRVLKLMVVR